MRNVLADLAVEAEAGPPSSPCGWPAPPIAAVRGDEHETLLRRIGLAPASTGCASAPPHAAGGNGMPGGNGYVEDPACRGCIARRRDGIWEGSGNVSALDNVARHGDRPNAVDVLFDELAKTVARMRASTLTSTRSNRRWKNFETNPVPAPARLPRTSASRCRARCGAHGHPAVAEAFLPPAWAVHGAGAFGTLPTGLDLAPIFERAMVKG